MRCVHYSRLIEWPDPDHNKQGAIIRARALALISQQAIFTCQESLEYKDQALTPDQAFGLHHILLFVL